MARKSAGAANPEASFASIRLTKRNFQGPSLLSHVGGRKVRRDNTNLGGKCAPSDYAEDGRTSVEKKNRKQIAEPATDDEPLSSSDSNSDESTRASSESARQNLFSNKNSPLSSGGKRKSDSEEENAPCYGFRKRRKKEGAMTNLEKKDKTSNQKPLLSRDTSNTQKSADSEDEMFGPWSSQASKRRTQGGYGSSKNVHTASSSLMRAPNSSIENKADSVLKRTESGLQNSANFLETEMPPASKTNSVDDGEFRLPAEIDVLSPLPKRQKNVQHDVKRKRDSPQPEFKVPFDLKNGGDPMDLVHSKEFQDAMAGSSVITSALNGDVDIENYSILDPSSSGTLELSEPVIFTEMSSEALCPMCKEPVEREALEEFKTRTNRRIREQQRFCDNHKLKSAEKEWCHKGYPTINWITFDERVAHHFSTLERILVPDCQSFFRNTLDTTLKSGKAKNFRLTISGDGLDNMSCGYYGSKGARKMLDLVTAEFRHKIKRLAAMDNVIRTAGVVAYCQAVLVPELTVLLVKEDMGVDDEDARRILRDSTEIGEKLNFDPNDEVQIEGNDPEPILEV